jgi:oxygen-dependent protoporphyrinogen oxidase
MTFDAVVFATGAAATATAIASAAPDAAALLAGAESADVIMVTLHVAAEQWPDRLRGSSGYLVPKPDQRWVTAASFASQKWGHWCPPTGGEILRVSIGRDGMAVMHLDDDEVLRVVLDDLEHHLGVRFTPTEVRITRWPAAFAQYRPHHAAWVDDVEAALPPGLFVVGAGFRGIGIPACVRAATSIAADAGTTARGLTESR